MKRNYMSGTNLEVSQLSLGTLMFGGRLDEADSLKIMDYAFSKGINLFDTADSYNQGETEKVVGKGLKGRRDRVILATKVGRPMGDDPNDSGVGRRHILRSIDQSLKRLDTDYVDIYYMHAPDHRTSYEESLETMSGLVKAGKARYIGVSNFAAWQIADMLAICDRRGYVPPVITQNMYNAITRGVEDEMIPFLRAHSISMAVFNPIAGGLLSGKHKPGQPGADTRFAGNKMYLDRYWSDKNFEAVEGLAAIASGRGMSLLELAMKWCVGQPGVTTVITGVSSMTHIEQNIASVEGEALDEATLERCDGVWRSLSGGRARYNE